MELRDYQEQGVAFLRWRSRAMLGDEMGLGKTPQLIRASEGDTLVVCPAGLVDQWRYEIGRWSETPDDFQVVSFHSLVDNDKRGARKRDGSRAILGVPRKQYLRDWDTLVVDEAHNIKGRDTSYAKGVVKLAKRSERFYAATGTPVRNWAHEIFMVLRAIYPGDKRFANFWEWADKWFEIYETSRYVGKGSNRTTRHVGPLRDITDWETFADRNGLSDSLLRRTLEDVDLELPDHHEVRVPVQLSRAERSVYNRLSEDYFATLPDGQVISALSEGEKFVKLRRLSSGLRFLEEDDGSGRSSKLEELGRIMDAGRDHQWVIFCEYRHSVVTVVDYLESIGIDTNYVHGGHSARNRSWQISAFNNGLSNALVATYPTLAEGHNLTSASRCVLFETSPVDAVMRQAPKRIHRLGQTKSCMTFHLVAEQTVDGYFADILLPDKRRSVSGLVSAASLKEYLS